MREEQLRFEELRDQLTAKDQSLAAGRMMSSPAIIHQDKVFCFLSRKYKMVFKLGKGYDLNQLPHPASEFSPFKSKKPLSGWYEVDFAYSNYWPTLASKALLQLKSELL